MEERGLGTRVRGTPEEEGEEGTRELGTGEEVRGRGTGVGLGMREGDNSEVGMGVVGGTSEQDQPGNLLLLLPRICDIRLWMGR